MPEDNELATTTAYINPEAKQIIRRQIEGKNMRALNLRRKAALRTAQLNGVRPATITNFNPLSLYIENGGLSFKQVPAGTDKEIKSLHDGTSNKIKLKYDNREYVGSYITIRDPQFAPRLRECQKGQSWDDPQSDWDGMIVKPIEVAHHFWTNYNLGNQDSCNMGGVLVFEGDRHTLDKAIKAAAAGKDEQAMLQVPDFEQFEVRDRQFEREFYTKPVHVIDLLKDCFEKQKAYCDTLLQRAQTYFNNEEMRSSITEPMRIWDRYAVSMGWRETVSAWTLSAGQDVKSCTACGAPRKRLDAFLCSACGRYYDPLKSFLEGKDVPHAELYGYKEEKEVAAIRAEMARRASIFAHPTPPQTGK